MSDSATMRVKHTEWTWLQGRVWADDVVVTADQPIRVTLHAQDLELRELLETFAKDKASGQGKISGQVPIVIDGSNVQFGEGMFTAFQGGAIQMKDATTLQTTAEAAAQSASGAASGQIKKNIIEALKDFQYDKLSARLEKDAKGGLVGRVRMGGRGRAGAKQALAYDLNINGLDDLLRSYLKIRGALSKPTTRAAAAASTRKAESQ